MSDSSLRRRLPRATELAHSLIGERLRAGDIAVDATMGNGYDTEILAEKVGADGKVFGFDIQPEAIAATRHRLESAGLGDRVRLFRSCHSRLGDELPETVKVVMFNLGYLPGGDKKRITLPETTLAALESASGLLAEGGLMTVVVYPGHEGGDVEAVCVESWASELDQDRFAVASYGFINQANSPPRLVVVEHR